MDKNTCMPFATRHRSQFFNMQVMLCRIMRHKNLDIINYIDDFLGYGVPRGMDTSFTALVDVMDQLGPTVSQKKLVCPTTRAMCLCIEVYTIAGNVLIPSRKTSRILRRGE